MKEKFTKLSPEEVPEEAPFSEQDLMQGGYLKAPLTPEEALIVKESLQRGLEVLTPREAEVLKQRYLKDETQEETAAYLGVKRGRVPQIEGRALRKAKAQLESGVTRLQEREVEVAERAKEAALKTKIEAVLASFDKWERAILEQSLIDKKSMATISQESSQSIRHIKEIRDAFFARLELEGVSSRAFSSYIKSTEERLAAQAAEDAALEIGTKEALAVFNSDEQEVIRKLLIDKKSVAAISRDVLIPKQEITRILSRFRALEREKKMTPEDKFKKELAWHKSPQDKEILRRILIDGDSDREISEALSVPLTTVMMKRLVVWNLKHAGLSEEEIVRFSKIYLGKSDR